MTILDNLITIIVGSITGVSRTITQGKSALEDFFYVRVSGLSFVVLGSRQVGKTTLIEWLKKNMDSIEGIDPEPTAAGGDEIPRFTAKVEGEHLRMRPTRDVGGEYAMWETDWVELFRQSQPRGIIFMIDDSDVHLQKDALNFVLQMIDDEPAAAKHLKAFFILVNKYDLWGEEKTMDDIISHYRNERRRLDAQAERIGYKYAITYGSLTTGKGVRPMMSKFFNVLRPKARKIIEIA
jgi:GTPase SAR1 family protein